MTPSDKEMLAILKLKLLINSSNPDMVTFIDWLADRLINVYNECPHIDFVQATRNYAEELRDIQDLLK